MKIVDINSWRQYVNSKYIDRTFWILYGILSGVAIIALFSASSSLVYQRGSILGPVMTQVLYLALGAGAAYLVQFIPSRMIRPAGYLLFIISDILLWLMLIPHFPGAVTINGATRWFHIGPLVFQPSEILKLGLIIVLSDLLSRIKSEEDKWRFFQVSIGITAAAVLPVMVQNMSTAILICLIVLILWILARMPWRYVGSVVGIALVAGLILFFTLSFCFHHGIKLPGHLSSTVTRVEAMFTEHKTDTADFKVTDDNYQRSMAKVAVARGGKTPFGVGPGNSQERDYLPLAFADYIFAIIVEETGIVGAIALSILYLMVLFRACYTSSRYADFAATYMVMGLALMLTCQALISMMVAVGLGPVTGQPLPLISRGGTSVMITSIYFGIMMAVSREQLEKKLQNT